MPNATIRQTTQTKRRPEISIDLSWTGTPVEWNLTPGYPYVDQDDVYFTPVGTEITIEADVRFSDSNYVALYEWRFGDGSMGYGQSVVHTYRVAMPEARLSLVITDGFGRKFSQGRQLNLQA